MSPPDSIPTSSPSKVPWNATPAQQIQNYTAALPTATVPSQSQLLLTCQHCQAYLSQRHRRQCRPSGKLPSVREVVLSVTDAVRVF